MNNIKIIKGIHPGFILERELRRRKLPKVKFAQAIQEYPQTLVSITKGKRKMNTALSIKIEQKLGLQEGYLMILQVYHDIATEKAKQHTQKPNLRKIRPILFWDTAMDKIDWERQKKAVIKRVFERGNEQEKREITRFYGSTCVLNIRTENGL
jgi:antitoxin HigA-1